MRKSKGIISAAVTSMLLTSNEYMQNRGCSGNSLMTILGEIKNLNMLDNIIIVFTADHGDMQGSRGLLGKGGFMYEYNTHVSMIIYHPDFEGG